MSKISYVYGEEYIYTLDSTWTRIIQPRPTNNINERIHMLIEQYRNSPRGNAWLRDNITELNYAIRWNHNCGNRLWHTGPEFETLRDCLDFMAPYVLAELITDDYTLEDFT